MVAKLYNTYISQNAHSWAEDESNAFIHEKWNSKYVISEILKTVKLNKILYSTL